MTTRLPVAERFAAKVQPGDGCWEWQGPLSELGYGQFQMNGRPYGAHRAAWIIANGEIEPGLVVRHKCDNRACVRLDHLELGTVKENAQDVIARGRKPTTYDNWVALGHAAALLGVKKDTLRQQINKGRLTGHRFRGSPWHIRRSELERYRRESLGRRGPASARLEPAEVERYRKEHKR